MAVTISLPRFLQAHRVLQFEEERRKYVLDALEDHLGDLALLVWSPLCKTVQVVYADARCLQPPCRSGVGCDGGVGPLGRTIL